VSENPLDENLEPVLSGEGASDYERYLRPDELLALQTGPEERAHRDELLFQTVHQSSEIWLKHACFEVETATELIRAADLAGANRLLLRAALGVILNIEHLRML
jgi:tryptophan 2,3-dioxygenase